jgi:hypothetical protein
MSLKFGIYLVEQRIISPEQFCGLVKIQQESATSLATIAIRKNMMSIRQVAAVLDIQESSPTKSFVSIAIENDFLDHVDADQLLRAQQTACPSIRRLVVECGLLTERQSMVLFQHFQKIGARPVYGTGDPTPTPDANKPSVARPGKTTETVPPHAGPRPPKFQQRPLIVHSHTKTP